MTRAFVGDRLFEIGVSSLNDIGDHLADAPHGHVELAFEGVRTARCPYCDSPNFVERPPAQGQPAQGAQPAQPGQPAQPADKPEAAGGDDASARFSLRTSCWARPALVARRRRVRGVRSSCERIARKSSFARLARSASSASVAMRSAWCSVNV